MVLQITFSCIWNILFALYYLPSLCIVDRYGNMEVHECQLFHFNPIYDAKNLKFLN